MYGCIKFLVIAKKSRGQKMPQDLVDAVGFG